MTPRDRLNSKQRMRASLEQVATTSHLLCFAAMKARWPAPERNKEPILDVLRRVLPESGTLLEIASGSGQHAAHFTKSLPRWTWIPSDVERDNLESIAAYRAEHTGDNFRAPLLLDVRNADWGVPPLDAAFNANMIHITPWSCCTALIAGVARYLRPGGVFVLYGPFRVGGTHTAESNASFDLNLRRQNERWGVRDVEEVVHCAAIAGLSLSEQIQMPAENQTLVFVAKPHEGHEGHEAPRD
jgi:SAM-dependent methyltransferase